MTTAEETAVEEKVTAPASEEDEAIRFLGRLLGRTLHAQEGGLAYETVEEILNRVVWRTNESDGTGGLFPLSRPYLDQRDVEIWSQLNAFLLEQD